MLNFYNNKYSKMCYFPALQEILNKILNKYFSCNLYYTIISVFTNYIIMTGGHDKRKLFSM